MVNVVWIHPVGAPNDFSVHIDLLMFSRRYPDNSYCVAAIEKPFVLRDTVEAVIVNESELAFSEWDLFCHARSISRIHQDCKVMP